MSLAEAAGVLSADTTRDGMGAAPSPLVPPHGLGASSGRVWGSLCPLGQPPASWGGSGCSLARMETQDPWHGPGWLLHPRGGKRGGRVLGAGWGGPWEGAQALFSFRKCLPSESVGRGAPAPAAGAACPRTSHGRAPRSGAGNLALLPKQPPGTSCCNRGDRLGVTCLALNA